MTAAAPPQLPAGMGNLPRDHVGRPIPWFVHTADDGTPDFRVVGADRITDALRFDLCWLCGRRRGRYGTFVVGPMCAVNRTSAEPPSHLECARYAAAACPFLATPGMRRRAMTSTVADTSGNPVASEAGTTLPAGVMIARNPGVTLLWTSRTWSTYTAPHPDGGRGLLVDLGAAEQVQWWREGRRATRAEVTDAVASGAPALREMAVQEGPRAVRELETALGAVDALLPAEQAP